MAHLNILRIAYAIKLRLSCQGYRDLMAITRTMRRELLMLRIEVVIVHNSGQMFAAPKVSRHDSRLDDQLRGGSWDGNAPKSFGVTKRL